MARDIAMTHHEKYDGSGYPHGLAGEEIPLCGRIVALADAYDALTSKRVYKDAIDHEKSVQIIVDDTGSHFDPEIVDVFLDCVNQFNEIRQSFCETKNRGLALHDPSTVVAAEPASLAVNPSPQ